MNLNSNLKFDEIIYRYAFMIALGIIGGMLHNYWFVIPVMAVFLSAVLGWCPIKAYMSYKKESSMKHDVNFLNHKTAH